jgi:hypothetical protein
MAALGVPADVVKPAQELIKAVAVDVLSATPIEMRIKLVDDRLTDKVGENSDAERENTAEKNNGEPKKLIQIRYHCHQRLPQTGINISNPWWATAPHWISIRKRSCD